MNKNWSSCQRMTACLNHRQRMITAIKCCWKYINNIVTLWPETGNTLSIVNLDNIVNMLSQLLNKMLSFHKTKKRKHNPWNSIWNTSPHIITRQVCFNIYVTSLNKKQLLATYSEEGKRRRGISLRAVVAVESSVHPEWWCNHFFLPQVIWFWVSADAESRPDTWANHYAKKRKEKKKHPGCPSSCCFIFKQQILFMWVFSHNISFVSVALFSTK